MRTRTWASYIVPLSVGLLPLLFLLTDRVAPVALLIAGIAAIMAQGRNAFRVEARAPFLALGALALWMVASGLWGAQGFDPVDDVAKLVLCAVFLVPLLAVGRDLPHRLPSLLLIAPYGLYAIYILWELQVTPGGPLPTVWEQTLNQRALSVGLLSFVMAVMVAGTEPAGPRRLFMVLMTLGFGGGATLFSHSQSGALAWLVGFACFAIALFAPRLMLRGVLVGACALPLLMPGIIVGLGGAIDLLLGTGSDLVRNSSAQARVDIWRVSMELIAQRPVIGWGLGGPEDPVRTVSEAGLFWPGLTMTFTHSHNVFLQVWLELGVVGAVILTVLFATIARLCWAVEGAWTAPFTGFVAALAVILSISHGAWQTWWIATLMLAAALVHAIACHAAR